MCKQKIKVRSKFTDQIWCIYASSISSIWYYNIDEHAFDAFAFFFKKEDASTPCVSYNHRTDSEPG